MNTSLAPLFNSELSGGDYIIWFKKSNTYSVISNELFYLVQLFLESTSKSDYLKNAQIDFGFEIKKAEKAYSQIESFLRNSNTISARKSTRKNILKSNKEYIKKKYSFNSKLIQFNFESEKALNFIHPQLKHFEIKKSDDKNDFVIFIQETKNEVSIFLNDDFVEIFNKEDYHLFYGKLIFVLLSIIHNISQNDWLAMFHGCMVAKKDKGILLIGQSGSGKSTLSALLASNGFTFVADDITPLCAKDLNFYKSPSAVSIKSGAIDTLRQFYPKIELMPERKVSDKKGVVKYLDKWNQKLGLNYKCKHIILVNYNSNIKKTKLEHINPSEALNVLIPDSWISPKQEHAKKLINWFSNVNYYKISYSNNQEAIVKLNSII